MIERYLANENFPAMMVRLLREQRNDVIHAAETLVGAPDERILHAAVEQDRVLLTLDRDFGELVFHRQKTPAPGIVLFRMGQMSPDGMLSFLQTFFEPQPPLRGFFTVASPGHFRQVPLGKQQE